MAEEQDVVVQKLDAYSTEHANEEVVHKIASAKSYELSTGSLNTENPKAVQLRTKDDKTNQTAAKVDTTEEGQPKTEMMLPEDGNPDIDGLRTFVIRKSRTHFDDDHHSEFDNYMFRQSSKDIHSLKGTHSTRSVIEKGFIDIDQDLEESDDSLESDASYIYQNELEIKPDFFDELGEIPDFSEMSFDLSFQKSRMSVKSIKDSILEQEDAGRFVNPLTGEVEPDSEIVSLEPEEEVELEIEEVEEESEYEKWDVDDDDLLVLLEVDKEAPTKKRRVTMERAFENFLEMETIDEKSNQMEIDYVAREQKAMKRQLLVITIDFISQLIKTVVETCEYIDPSIILRHNLDKVKLMDDIQSKFPELEVEQKTRVFLNRKTVDYFKRKRMFKSILADNPDTVTEDIQKFKEASEKLDRMMGRENELKSAATEKITNLNAEVASKEEEARNEITDFENMVKKSLRRDTYDKLPSVVIDFLSRIEQLRNEVSEVRLTLIQRQHTFASLVEKLSKLENIGDDLCMTDFEHLQTQTQALGSKIEERNSELNKLRIRCNAELHIMSHMKEKQKMMQSTISIQRTALGELQWQKKYMRERLFQLKMKRARIRQEIHEVSFQGGILGKPALMFDYDDTVDQLRILHSKIKQYKKKYSELQKKIQQLERKCDHNH